MQRVLFVPGRIEVLGKHTDYGGGRSLLCATRQGIRFSFTPRDDDEMRIRVGGGEERSFRIDPDLVPTVGHWSNYAMTVARRVARNFPGSIRGADVEITSDLPPAAGLSSSSAVIVGYFLVLSDVNRLGERDEYRTHIKSNEDLANYLGCVENGSSFGNLSGDRGVGTFGGSQDHTAILCCRQGMISQYSFCPVRHERTIPLSDEYTFVVANSGVVAQKTGDAMAKFNRISGIVAQMVQRWRNATGREDRYLADAVDSAPDAPQRVRELLKDDEAMRRRLEQFLRERDHIIPNVAALLLEGKPEQIGPLVDESQRLSETHLGNQIPETMQLARAARAQGALAASAFGAGFGGSVWALVHRNDATRFADKWSQTTNASCFTTDPAAPARLL